jgi:hypothetical protein
MDFCSILVHCSIVVQLKDWSLCTSMNDHDKIERLIKFDTIEGSIQRLIDPSA